jgi:hypothetical protein
MRRDTYTYLVSSVVDVLEELVQRSITFKLFALQLFLFDLDVCTVQNRTVRIKPAAIEVTLCQGTAQSAQVLFRGE